MKRDMGLVREILLKIEQAPGLSAEEVDEVTFEETHEPMLADLLKDPNSAAERARVGYHVRMLVEEDFLKGDDGASLVSEDWYNLRLSWHGHEFLDTLRDDTVWEKTQSVAKQAGVVSAKAFLDIGKTVAASLIAGILKQHGIGGP